MFTGTRLEVSLLDALSGNYGILLPTWVSGRVFFKTFTRMQSGYFPSPIPLGVRERLVTTPRSVILSSTFHPPLSSLISMALSMAVHVCTYTYTRTVLDVYNYQVD